MVIFGVSLLEWSQKHRGHRKESREIRDMGYLYKFGFKAPDKRIITVAKVIHCHQCNEVFVYDYLNDEVKL